LNRRPKIGFFYYGWYEYVNVVCCLLLYPPKPFSITVALAKVMAKEGEGCEGCDCLPARQVMIVMIVMRVVIALLFQTA